MSWPRAIVATLLLAALAGCGFRPLYGTHSNDPVVADELQSIYVRPISEREGQLVRNALLVRLNPAGEPRQPRYQLVVGVNASEASVALQKDQTASRDEVTYRVDYELYDGNVEVTRGTFSHVFAFDFLPQQYANITARADVGKRAAEEIGDEIRNRMAAYFIRARRAAAAQPQTGP